MNRLSFMRSITNSCKAIVNSFDILGIASDEIKETVANMDFRVRQYTIAEEKNQIRYMTTLYNSWCKQHNEYNESFVKIVRF